MKVGDKLLVIGDSCNHYLPIGSVHAILRIGGSNAKSTNPFVKSQFGYQVYLNHIDYELIPIVSDAYSLTF